MFLLEKIRYHEKKNAIAWKDRIFTYADLLFLIEDAISFLKKNNVTNGSIVSLEADFSPRAIAMLLALIEKKAIIVPLSSSISDKADEFRKVSEVELRLVFDDNDNMSYSKTDNAVTHHLLKELRQKSHSGLILFSSGSTGQSKAIVHDLDLFLEKYQGDLKQKSTIAFLLFDHVGGIDTIFYTIASGGFLITLANRQPSSVCLAIERYSAEVLPVSPSFLNLLLISEEYKNYDLSSLQFITYGAELMNDFVLQKIHQIFPNLKIKQKYGLSETGVFKSQSES